MSALYDVWNVYYNFWWSFSNSLLQLFSGGASSLVVITSVGAVNSRHLLYGAVFSEYLSHLKLTWKIILSYVLVDQAFAVSNDLF